MASLVLTDSSQLTSDSQHLVSSIHKTGCYQRLEGEEGYLDSPNYPAEYPQGLECCYEIARPSSRYCGLMLYGMYWTVSSIDYLLKDRLKGSSPHFPGGIISMCLNASGYTSPHSNDADESSREHIAPQFCGADRVATYQRKSHLFQVLKTVEDGDFCLTDWFAMDSCVPEGGSRLCGNLTGSTFQYLFQPGSRAIRFIFHSSKSKCDRTLEYRYQLKYHLLKDCDGLFQEAVHTDIPGETSTPCYTRIADRSGTINTPYHPSVYPNNVDCVYEFVRYKKRHHLINASQYHLTLSTPSHKQDNVSPRASAATSRARLDFAIAISILDLVTILV
uniref:CUB domain-containing protein n=1 Tax=Timema shepardi TaxID=629360 RepID=A0A7R9B1A5_TIMSH|nr:unnamed protein product [Timema shepardi]